MSEVKDSFELPIYLRRYENLHIVFWLLKDMSWSMGWKCLGVIMIAPTLFLSIYLTMKFKKNKTEWFHNNAVICWIIANSYWMISEFYDFEESIIYGSIKYVHLSLIPFGVGLFLIGYYYLTHKFRAPKTDL